MQELKQGKNPCEVCGSQDNLHLFENGSIWCYTPSCSSNKNRTRTHEEKVLDEGYDYINKRINNDLISGVFAAIPARRLSQKTCEFFNYQQGVDNGAPVQIANYNGVQKIRTKDKRFYWKGDTTKIGLFGKEKWSHKGKNIIITEGEIDALSIAETQDCKWPVVSLPNGAQSARKILQSELDWLLGFETIILCFDSDEAGKSAVESCTDLFPPGRLKIASLSAKDANEVLCKGGFDELSRIVFTASEYRPDGIIKVKEIDINKLFKPKPRGYSLPFPLLDDAMRGCPKGRITTFYGLTGRGKTTTFKECILHQATKYKDLKIGAIFLEENKDMTLEYLLAMQNNVITWKVCEDPSLLTDTQKQEAYNNLQNLELYDHFGSMDPNRLLNIIEFWAAQGIKIIYLDHITMVFSGLNSGHEGQAKEIDIFMTKLRSLVERTQIHLITATQLKRRERTRDANGHEDISESDARGCVDGETEFLTPKGWVKIKDFLGGDNSVGVYDTKTKELKFEYILNKQYIKKSVDKFYHLKSTRGIDQVVSPEHGMLYQHGLKGRNANLNKCTAEEFVNRHKDSIIGNRSRFRTTFKSHGTYNELGNISLIRLAIAYQADGTLAKRRLCHVFKFKKQRKYDRLKKLLKDSGLVFKDYGKFNCGQFCIETKLPIAFKEFPLDWWKLNENDARLVIDEVKYWDSELSTGRYCTTNKENADFIQYCYAICGIRSTINHKIRNGKWKGIYLVTPSKNNTVSLANKDQKIEINEYKEHDGYKYCFTTSTGAWVARRNGRIFITSNSGSIEQISDYLIFLHRDKKGDRPDEIDYELSKNRYTGIEGMMDTAIWGKETGRLLPKPKQSLEQHQELVKLVTDARQTMTQSMY